MTTLTGIDLVEQSRGKYEDLPVAKWNRSHWILLLVLGVFGIFICVFAIKVMLSGMGLMFGASDWKSVWDLNVFKRRKEKQKRRLKVLND